MQRWSGNGTRASVGLGQEQTSRPGRSLGVVRERKRKDERERERERESRQSEREMGWRSSLEEESA